MVLEYFVDKIYLYDDKVILTCRYSDADYEVDWRTSRRQKKPQAVGSAFPRSSPPTDS